MAGSSREITFVVSGKEQPTDHMDPGPSGTSLRSAVRVGARRGNSDVVRVKAKVGEDVVRIHIANGPTLYLHPENALELLRAQAGASPGGQRGGNGVAITKDEVVVPSQLAWRGLESTSSASTTRGGLANSTGNVVVDGVDVITGLLKGKLEDRASNAIIKKFDGHVDAGVYQLRPDSLQALKGSGDKLANVRAASEPMLVLVHGTFSDIPGTFGKLWQTQPARVQELFQRYENRVYALDHPTLGASPFENALTLVQALPKGARLHLVTHSRGGLVAEALARVCGGLGASDADFEFFKDAKYQGHRQELTQLIKEARDKKIVVERIVRVACPARGTLLASRRLDAYLSVFKWGLEIAGVPVLPQLLDFIGDVARRRAKPDEFPGLEAQMPKHPFTKWLNAPGDPIAGDLRVVAGDIQGDSLLSWLKTLLTDAFYWTDHDLVVQTRSMYGGAPRAEGGATFILDRGSKVNHFSYFSNERTANLITRALIDDKPEFFSTIGPLSWAGEDSSGTRAARAATLSRGVKFAERPAVFVLPGILGSHLKVDGKRIWLSVRFINNLEQIKWDPKKLARVAPDGPVGMSYDDLIERLAETHEVVPFSYDWRRPIEDEARRLADEVEKALAARERTQQPVRIVAHSMGGVVARTMQLERPETWKRFMSRQGSRFLMLGTPNGGSFAPMQVMSGDDTFGNLFSMVGSLFAAKEARQLVADMPGLVQLQAGLTGASFDLGKEENWRKLARADLEKLDNRVKEGSFWHNQDEQREILEWGIPSQATLDKAVALRKRLDEQLDKFGMDTANMALVVGNAKSTPADVGISEDGDVLYSDTPLGDGRVTLTNALIPNVRTWQVDAVHGDLADERKAFDAYLDLLNTGETTRLGVVSLSRATRGAGAGEVSAEAPALTRSRPSRGMRDAVPPSTMNDVFSRESDQAQPDPATSGSRLNVRVTNGNLKFVRDPLLVGHYHSLKLTGAEYPINRLIGGTMSQSLDVRRYPSAVGTSQVFANIQLNPDNPFAMPRPEAVIVIGLGEEGALRTSELIDSVRQGVIAYSQSVAERASGAPSSFELASTLIGSGGITVTAGAAAQAIAMGVVQANALLATVGWPVVSRLQLIEIYLDRAAEALNALRSMGDSDAQGIVVEPFVETGQGGLPRPPEFGYRGADYDLISVYQRQGIKDRELEFTLSTRRARQEVRGARAQSKLVQDLIVAGASAENQDARIGRTLFQLLVPVEIESFLAGSTALLLQVDSGTAAYPWEMLDLKRNDLNGRSEHVPWGIQTRMLRKLRTPEFRESPRSSISGGVLVIGEPQCPPDKYPPLPGASTEAREVAKVLGAQPLLKGDGLAITTAVFDRSFSILHIAGHGDIVDGNGGVVLSSGMTFGAREIKAMRIVPDLAFVNCCHLGKFSDDSQKRRPTLASGLPAFAANVAEELIKIGVKCVVAAGWAVDDDAAMLFARTFYSHLVRGHRFVDAVGQARALTYAQYPTSNTWAAYQCYGDPDWNYGSARQSASASRPRPPVVSARGLTLRLRSLAVNHKFDDLDPDSVRDDLRYLLGASKPEWLKLGMVADCFGGAYAEIGDFEDAIEWFEKAVKAADGSAGLRALEQLGNMQARQGARTRNVALVRKGIALLERVVDMSATVERLSLLGSAHKRLAGIVGSSKGSLAAMKAAHLQYAKAEQLARAENADELFYPALNCMSLEIRIRSRRSSAAREFDSERMLATRQSLEQKNRANADFWSVVGVTELAIYEALAKNRLAGVVDSALVDFRDVAGRASGKKDWDSVFYQMRQTLEDYQSSSGISAQERAAVDKLLKEIPQDKKADEAQGVSGRSSKRPRKQKAKK